METDRSMEMEILQGYESNKTILEFTLITGGLVKGRIKWVDKHCIGVKIDDNHSMILYKHAIAFIQEKG